MRTVFYKYDEAADLYLQALSVQPEFYPAYTRLATVRWELGRLAEAIRYGEKSIAIEPAVEWTRERLVVFYVELGDLAAARDVLRGYPAGSLVAAAAPEALICYRAGQQQRVVDILRKYGAAPVFNYGFAGFTAQEGGVEHAIANHDPSLGRQVLLLTLRSKEVGRTTPMGDDDFPQIVFLANLEHTVGDQAVGNELTQHILQYLDRGPDVHLIAGWDEWSRAAAYTILGRNDVALDHLESMMRANFRLGWWSRVERDPVFAPLRGTSRFQRIVSDLKVWLENEERQVSQMRSSGEIPRRSAAQLTANGC
jgi:tetratricopeptide (TPR) repeat protein